MRFKNTLFKRSLRKIANKLKTEKSKVVLKTILLTFILSYATALICAKTGIIEIEWQLLFVPAIVVLQIIIIVTAFKDRYKKI
ncbi:hypothetical protein ACRASX_09450 [Flavobacterium sp. TMP13]|uniref:hypothetical protein n=1 Tax=unclassified Flavobacterium TaxID=196869 RepID=UPI00076D5AEF|nr:hypothetical protein [Flavobacterium sp. TAB 87]KVV15300.1 hypothetical protein AP058_00963 [Flavobacterium sp. TAB 87]